MAKILDQPRYKCALAAMQTVQSIPRALPILHSGPGCSEKLNGSIGDITLNDGCIAVLESVVVGSVT